MKTNWLASFFAMADEIVDAAQSPAAKFASTVLPVIAPLVPAFITGVRLHAMYISLVNGSFPKWVPTTGAIITALVLEFLGWVGTIAFVRNLYKWAKTKEDEYLVPTILSFLAYSGYIIDMWMVNSERTSQTNIFLLLSLFSVPAGFLFAVTLVTSQDEKNEVEIRRERREERLERLRIKTGNKLESSKKFPEEDGSFQEVSKKSPDWRKVRLQLSREQLENLANLNPDQMRQYASSTGFTYKTISNWRRDARTELGMSQDQEKE